MRQGTWEIVLETFNPNLPLSTAGWQTAGRSAECTHPRRRTYCTYSICSGYLAAPQRNSRAMFRDSWGFATRFSDREYATHMIK